MLRGRDVRPVIVFAFIASAVSLMLEAPKSERAAKDQFWSREQCASAWTQGTRPNGLVASFPYILTLLPFYLFYSVISSFYVHLGRFVLL